MGFFDNAWKAMDGFAQEATKHIGPAAAEVWKQADKFGQEQLAPAAAETWKHLDAFGQEAGKKIGPVAGEAWKRADEFGQEAGKQIGPAAVETWKHMDKFGQDAGEWVREHPGETAGIVACVVAAPVAIGVANVGLKVAGFTAAGVATGLFACAPYPLVTILTTYRFRGCRLPVSNRKRRRRKCICCPSERWSWRCGCGHCPRYRCRNSYRGSGRCDCSCGREGCQERQQEEGQEEQEKGRGCGGWNGRASG
jgi:hypothetical protein